MSTITLALNELLKELNITRQWYLRVPSDSQLNNLMFISQCLPKESICITE